MINHTNPTSRDVTCAEILFFGKMSKAHEDLPRAPRNVQEHILSEIRRAADAEMRQVVDAYTAYLNRRIDKEIALLEKICQSKHKTNKLAENN